ncbi:hypothetical protein BDD12DRAFT_858196 [Trichophaea hybrida]|nr:hypothetical protein BDD12DRAFT_858196 [Trichophaea hybrida]
MIHASSWPCMISFRSQGSWAWAWAWAWVWVWVWNFTPPQIHAHFPLPFPLPRRKRYMPPIYIPACMSPQKEKKREKKAPKAFSGKRHYV